VVTILLTLAFLLACAVVATLILGCWFAGGYLTWAGCWGTGWFRTTWL
jgi:hypothetical protein